MEQASRRRFRRARAWTLGGVYVFFVVHFIQWKISGRTLAPLEFSEAMQTLELGIVTAGFLFLAVSFLAAAVVGRFFCGWACHILALQDASAYLLGKVGIRPKPVRSRLLLFVPPIVCLYMFVWPTLKRLWEGVEAPALRIATDADGWASFVTKDLWRAMPGPFVTALTLGMCGFAIVYFLGSRSFCSYACPYGALLGAVDRFAPGRIVAKGDCTGCGKCTAACETQIDVKNELVQFGKIVNPACLKAMDCVDACPEGNVVFGFARPAFFQSWRKLGRFGIPYDFTLAEDALMAVVFVATLTIFRSLYDSVALFLSLVLAGIFAYLAVLALRLVRVPNVRFNAFQLRLKGAMRPAGWAYVGAMLVLALFVAHSALIRWHEWRGIRAFEEIKAGVDRGVPPDVARAQAAQADLDFCERYGLFVPPMLDRRLASLHLFQEQRDLAEPHVRRIVERAPEDAEWRLTLAAILLAKNDVAEAVQNLESVTERPERELRDDPRAAGLRASAHEMLAEVRRAQGDEAAALREAEAAQRLRTAPPL